MIRIIGHQKQWEFLKRAFLEGNLSHGYLFSGPEGVGKKTLAIEFIKFLNCKADFQERPCNFCSSCQALEKRIHPDFVFIEPEKREIKIDRVRELIWKLSLRPSISNLKAALINEAHLMSQEAQNCLLKTLEEPKGNSILFLITEHPQFLVETILSRLQEIKFFPVSEKAIEDFLKKKKIEEIRIKEIKNASLGKPGKVIKFLEDPKKLEKEKEKILNLIKILNSDLDISFQLIKILSREDLNENLEIWLRYFRELLLFKIGVLEKEPLFEKNFSFLKTIKIIKELERLNILSIKKGINKRLALEILRLNIENGLPRDY